MNPQRKIFSLEQANALVPQLESLLGELEVKFDAFRKLQDELFFMELLEGMSPPEERLQEMETTLTVLEHEIENIRGLGCTLRHVERGLVDFLARRQEEWFYYCWRRGEKAVRFYHSLRGGFLERQPLTEKQSTI